MTFSFLIVTRNRPVELGITLDRLKSLMNSQRDEVLVLIDDCSKTEELTSDYPWVKWTISKNQLGASPARNQLYKLATNDILIGLDDDSHPLTPDFLSLVELRFRESENTAILAFQEVTGIFQNDMIAREHAIIGEKFLTNDFVGSGFAICKKVYDQIEGFPVWMDIYGEESAVALQVLDLGMDIYYQYDLAVNHRKDKEARSKSGANYFRFEKQLVNSIGFYLVYYPRPLKKIVKLLVHNARKYAFKNTTYFFKYFKAITRSLLRLPIYMKHRKTVAQTTIERRNKLALISY